MRFVFLSRAKTRRTVIFYYPIEKLPSVICYRRFNIAAMLVFVLRDAFDILRLAIQICHFEADPVVVRRFYRAIS
jgi:hypothetical protein